MTRKLLGQVGVDSGQLMVIDPCYINSEWKKEGSVLGVNFWGQGQERVAHSLEEEGIAVELVDDGRYRVITGDAEALIEKIKTLSKNIGQIVIAVPHTDSTYDKICDITMSEDQGGKLDHGLAVVFSSGLGDGLYDVYATYKTLDGWGERITKVEIELISDDEFE